MADLTQRLIRHRVIGLDTSLFIYHFEQHPHYQSLTTRLLQRVESGQHEAIFSVMGLMEITTRPWSLGQGLIAHEYEALLANFPHLILAPATRPVARQAGRLRGQYNLRPADALHVATAMVNGATLFLTNDRRLARVNAEISVLILDDYRSSGNKMLS